MKYRVINKKTLKEKHDEYTNKKSAVARRITFEEAVKRHKFIQFSLGYKIIVNDKIDGFVRTKDDIDIQYDICNNCKYYNTRFKHLCANVSEYGAARYKKFSDTCIYHERVSRKYK